MTPKPLNNKSEVSKKPPTIKIPLNSSRRGTIRYRLHRRISITIQEKMKNIIIARDSSMKAGHHRFPLWGAKISLKMGLLTPSVSQILKVSKTTRTISQFIKLNKMTNSSKTNQKNKISSNSFIRISPHSLKPHSFLNCNNIILCLNYSTFDFKKRDNKFQEKFVFQ